MNIAVIDCAVETSSRPCFDRLSRELHQELKYFWPVRDGFAELEATHAERFIILGSYSNVEDRLPWQKQLAHFCSEQLLKRTPVLGICFGHQLMADFFGATVKKMPSSQSGTRLIRLSTNLGPLKQGDQLELIVHHAYEVHAPPSALITLSEGPACAHEILRHNELPFIGIQAHPEASEHFVQQNIPEGLRTDRAYQDGLSFIQAFLEEPF